ncbi:MAG: S8 family serine peptidase, partial [Chloroflexi bacterium]|nr:S8 family serine peptidase [Chloroflexota bacterium]
MLRRTLALIALLALLLVPSVDASSPAQQSPYRILLRSRQFTPSAGIESSARARLQSIGTHHVLVQLNEIPSEADKAALDAQGVHLLGYVPERAWFARVDGKVLASLSTLGRVRWLAEIEIADKMPARLLSAKPLAHATQNGTLRVRVAYFEDVSESAAVDALTRHNAVVELREPSLHALTARLPLGSLRALADEDAIRWVAEVPPPPTPANDGIRARIRADVVHSAPYNLSGSGVTVGIWDCTAVGPHIDFSGRLTNVEPTTTCGDGQNQNHATHVAGTLAGSGANSQVQGGTQFQWKGIAPGAQLISYDFNNASSEMLAAVTTYNIDLSNNSWGYQPNVNDLCTDVLGNYSSVARDYDTFINAGLNGKRIPVTFAAGNLQGGIGGCTGYGTITPPGTAKNVVTVSATNSNDDTMTSFSSWGPTDDGRLKPDVVAPGCRTDFPNLIKSTLPNDVYGYNCGTSMATPAVSGLLALLLQQHRITTCVITPLPSTLKAMLIQGAVDLGATGPDYKFGWGRVDALNSVELARKRRALEGIVSSGQVLSYTIDVTSSATPLKTTLVWDDP